MKKIYITLSALFFVGSQVYSQNLRTQLDAQPTIEDNPSIRSTTKISKKATANVFWYEDFANGVGGNSVDGLGNPIGGSWTRGFTGATDYSTIWKFDTQGPQGQYEQPLPLLSESGGNGWMIFDSNYQTDLENNGGFIEMDGFLETPDIDISGMGTIALGVEIQHSYRTCCAGATKPVNLFAGYFNGTEWVWVRKNTGNTAHNTRPALRTSTGYEVETKLINIADVAQEAANAGTDLIRIRFHWNADLNGSSSYYYWMIDDVRIIEIKDFDSKLVIMHTGDIVNDFEYYAIPEDQVVNYPTVVGGTIENMGRFGLTGVNLDVTITEDATSSVVHSSNSPTINIAAGGSSTIWYNTNFIPSNKGIYTVEISSDHNEVDEQPGDNSDSKKFEITEYEFSHYNPHSSTLGVVGVNAAANQGRQSSLYLINEDATIFGMYVFFRDGTTLLNTRGQIGSISIRDAADGVSIIRDQEFVLCDPCVNDNVMSIRFDNPLNVFAGDAFYASVDAFGGGDEMVIAADYNGDLDRSTLIERNGSLFIASYDNYVNLSFDPNIITSTFSSTKEITNNGLSLMQNIPNPATFSTEIRYSLGNTANVKLEVVDVTGKVIATHALGMRAAGDHSFELNTSDFADGIYYYTLTAGADRLSNKMVVRK
jgi:hypothetical protein